MATKSIYKKLESLPPTLKEEAKKFIDSLIEKTKKEDNPSKPSKPIYGSLRGKIHLANDFDEPLDEFKEYME
jgi:hypothetical protein